MESYRDFARVYDEFMDQTPYDEWLLNILNIFKEYKIDKDAQVLDLGCGTGKMARKLAREGYQVTAVDNSMDIGGAYRYILFICCYMFYYVFCKRYLRFCELVKDAETAGS